MMSPGTNSGAIGGCSHKGRNDNDFIVARADRHAYAVVFAALIFAQQRVGLGIKEIGVRIEHVQHARNGAVVNGLVGVHRLGIVLLDQAVHVGELPQAVTDVGVAARGCRGVDFCPKTMPRNPQVTRMTTTTGRDVRRELRAIVSFLRFGT